VILSGAFRFIELERNIPGTDFSMMGTYSSSPKNSISKLQFDSYSAQLKIFVIQILIYLSVEPICISEDLPII